MFKFYLIIKKTNIQNEYYQKPSMINANTTTVDDDDFIPSEPPARADYGKKALVNENFKNFLCFSFNF